MSRAALSHRPLGKNSPRAALFWVSRYAQQSALATVGRRTALTSRLTTADREFFQETPPPPPALQSPTRNAQSDTHIHRAGAVIHLLLLLLLLAIVYFAARSVYAKARSMR